MNEQEFLVEIARIKEEWYKSIISQLYLPNQINVKEDIEKEIEGIKDQESARKGFEKGVKWFYRKLKELNT